MMFNDKSMQYLNHFFLYLLVIGCTVSGCKKDATTASTTPDEGLTTGKLQVFPKDNPWNTDISNSETDPNSDNIIAGIGNTVHLHPDFGTVWDLSLIHISEPTRRTPISYAVFCLKKKK